TGTIKPNFSISEATWDSLERTYGCKIPTDVRTLIESATVRYLWLEQMEREAGSLDSAQACVSTLCNDTEKLLQKLQDVRDCKDDARTFVRYAIDRQLGLAGRSERLRKYGSASRRPIVDRIDQLVRDLSGLRSALTALVSGDLQFIEPQQEGQAFGRWLLEVKSIMLNARLPTGARKDRSTSAVDSPFVRLMCELQNHFPKGGGKPFTDSRSMAEAIHRYERASRHGAFSAKPSPK